MQNSYCNYEANLMQIWENFCWWDLQDDTFESTRIRINLNYDTNYNNYQVRDYLLDPIKQRKRRSNLPNIDANLMKLLSFISSNKKIEFDHCDKSLRGLHNGVSVRRSQFIGVLKNGNRWQVLINVGRIKKYIGTFLNEKEAAIVHDFYSMGINGGKGKTNFSYNRDLVESMITSYFTNDKYFDATPFIQMV